MDYRFTDLVDIEAFRDMLKSFYEATGILHGLVDEDNQVISAIGWEQACTEFHRAYPLSRQRCEQSNQELAAELGSEPFTGVRCRNGLMDYACPIIIEGKQMATLYYGQIFHEPPDMELFRRQAKECSYDEEAYLEAIDRVPIVPRERVESIMAFFSQLAQMLARSGLDRMHAKETEAKLAELNRGLTRCVKQRTKELADKNSVLEMIAQGASLSDILHTLIRSVEEEEPEMLASILLLDEEGRHLRTGAAPSLPDFYNQAVDGLAIGASVGSCGTAAYTRQRVVVTDIQNHPYWANYRDLADSAGIAACWSEPVFSSKGRVLGTFAIYHRQPTEPSESDLILIGQAANLASIAIEHHQTLDVLERQAHTDSLTGLANRGHFMKLAEAESARSRRYGKRYGMLLIDIDRFKAINDDYGHESGDRVLQRLAAVLVKTLREVDIIGRLGGDEFTVLLPETDREEVMEVAERLRKVIAESQFPLGDKPYISLTVSIGVALPAEKPEGVESILQQADEALYMAKKLGRNRVCIENKS